MSRESNLSREGDAGVIGLGLGVGGHGRKGRRRVGGRPEGARARVWSEVGAPRPSEREGEPRESPEPVAQDTPPADGRAGGRRGSDAPGTRRRRYPWLSARRFREDRARAWDVDVCPLDDLTPADAFFTGRCVSLLHSHRCERRPEGPVRSPPRPAKAVPSSRAPAPSHRPGARVDPRRAPVYDSGHSCAGTQVWATAPVAQIF